MNVIDTAEFSAGRLSRPLAAAAFGLRVFFGAFFVISGLLKAQDPGLFLENIRSFQVLRDPWAAWLALGLPWLEILAGGALVLGRGVEGSLLIFIGSLVVFIAALAQAWVRGLDVTCGCFGRSENHTNFPMQIGFDVGLLMVAGGLVWARMRIRNQASEPHPRDELRKGRAR